MKKLLLLLLIVSVAAQAQDKFTFVFLHKKTDQKELPKEEVDKIMKGHMANMQRLAKEGQLLAAGPFDGGGGIFIFKSTSQDEVKELLATDPGVKAERWNVEILPYQPRIGGICPVGEKYEMTSYQFVHFKPNVMKFNVQNADETIRKHIAFVKELNNGGNVITEATFGGLDGGILVMKGDLQPEVISADPAVAEGLFEPDFKKLWIAKGSFCEK
ncbi:MAG: YciI family protein [Bacteroidota bacterium]